MTRRLELRSAAGEHLAAIGDDGRVDVDGAGLTITWDDANLARADGERVWVAVAGTTRWVFHDGCVYELEIDTPDTARRTRTHQGALAAPMPATVRQIRVKPGDVVRQGDTLILLEAMKMELPVRAGADGVVTSINCREGELVQPGAALIDVRAAEGA